MSFTVWLLFVTLVAVTFAAYIFITLQLKKLERFGADLYRELDELARKYKEMYHDNDDVK